VSALRLRYFVYCVKTKTKKEKSVGGEGKEQGQLDVVLSKGDAILYNSGPFLFRTSTSSPQDKEFNCFSL
jgi:hypothetical protein